MRAKPTVKCRKGYGNMCVKGIQQCLVVGKTCSLSF